MKRSASETPLYDEYIAQMPTKVLKERTGSMDNIARGQALQAPSDANKENIEVNRQQTTKSDYHEFVKATPLPKLPSSQEIDARTERMAKLEQQTKVYAQINKQLVKENADLVHQLQTANSNVNTLSMRVKNLELLKTIMKQDKNKTDDQLTRAQIVHVEHVKKINELLEQQRSSDKPTQEQLELENAAIQMELDKTIELLQQTQLFANEMVARNQMTYDMAVAGEEKHKIELLAIKSALFRLPMSSIEPVPE